LDGLVVGVFLRVTARTQRLEVVEPVAAPVGLRDDVVDLQPHVVDAGVPDATRLTLVSVTLQHAPSPGVPVRRVLVGWVVGVRRVVRFFPRHETNRRWRPS
jgi:hypothetical protein